MCLIVTTAKTPLVADTDVECYKVLWYYFNRSSVWYSPILSSKYYPDVVKESPLDHVSEDDCRVERGLHSFVKLASAEYSRDYMRRKHLERCKSEDVFSQRVYVVAKCVIPASAEYYGGTWRDTSRNHLMHESYASNKLIITEIL